MLGGLRKKCSQDTYIAHQERMQKYRGNPGRILPKKKTYKKHLSSSHSHQAESNAGNGQPRGQAPGLAQRRVDMPFDLVDIPNYFMPGVDSSKPPHPKAQLVKYISYIWQLFDKVASSNIDNIRQFLGQNTNFRLKYFQQRVKELRQKIRDNVDESDGEGFSTTAAEIFESLDDVFTHCSSDAGEVMLYRALRVYELREEDAGRAIELEKSSLRSLGFSAG